jgi:hypothetical protein
MSFSDQIIDPVIAPRGDAGRDEAQGRDHAVPDRDPALSAIRRRPNPRPTLLVFEIAGKISKSDIEDMATQIDQAFDTLDRVDLLLIMTDFEGMDTDAVFDREALATQVRSLRHVRKYGVVGAPGWARAMIEFSDVLTPVEAKTFDLAQEAEAWAWIET